jgi:hypothetical protein
VVRRSHRTGLLAHISPPNHKTMAAWFVTYSRDVLLIVFAAALIGKVKSYPSFIRALDELGIARIPGNVVAPCVLGVESAVICSMLLPANWLKVGFVLAFVLVASFSMMLRRMQQIGFAAGCPCFGSASQSIDSTDFIRNANLLVISLGGILALTRHPEGPIGWLQLSGVVCLGAAFVTAFFLMYFKDIWFLSQSVQPTMEHR